VQLVREAEGKPVRAHPAAELRARVHV
jgi:hypothetical protein